MPKITFVTIVRLVLASFLVGMALAFFDVTPQELLAWLHGLAAGIIADLWSWVSRGASYVLVGAVVVVPVWLLSLAWKVLRGRR